jgi:primosomal replication protein N
MGRPGAVFTFRRANRVKIFFPRGLAAVNKAILGGTISSYGVCLSYTPASKPQLTFSLTLTEGDYHTFVPCQIVGPQAEVLAETLEAGDYCLLEGKLSWKKEQSKLMVVAFGCERLSTAGVTERDTDPEGRDADEGALNLGHSGAPERQKVRKPRLPKHLQRAWQPEHAN